MVIGERPSLDKWHSIHYIPANGNAWDGAGETLEVSIADFGISQLAGPLGQTGTQQQFLARSQPDGQRRLGAADPPHRERPRRLPEQGSSRSRTPVTRLRP
jgi:hypothetical protein